MYEKIQRFIFLQVSHFWFTEYHHYLQQQKAFLWHRKNRLDAVFNSTTAKQSNKSASSSTAVAKFAERCRYFDLGLCRKGSKCRYAHDQTNNNNNTDDNDDNNDNNNDDDKVKVEKQNTDNNSSVASDAKMTTSTTTTKAVTKSSASSATLDKTTQNSRNNNAGVTASNSKDDLLVLSKRLTWLLRHGAGFYFLYYFKELS